MMSCAFLADLMVGDFPLHALNIVTSGTHYQSTFIAFKQLGMLLEHTSAKGYQEMVDCLKTLPHAHVHQICDA